MFFGQLYHKAIKISTEKHCSLFFNTNKKNLPKKKLKTLYLKNYTFKIKCLCNKV